MIAKPYPLQWPVGVPRTEPGDRQSGAFKARGSELTVARAIHRVEDEIRRMQEAWLETLIVSSNIAGTSRSQPDDPGVAIYFTRGDKTYCFPCDRYRKVADNIAAVAKHLEAMRGMERWGVGTVDQLFGGFTALPAPAGDWRSVLGIQGDGIDREVVEARYRSLARRKHPDAGGSHDDFIRLQDARSAALAEIGAEA